jgi:hypothetical protein
VSSHRALVSLTILVALVPIAVPQADACLASAGAPHRCCAPPAAPEITAETSCCGGDASSRPPSASTRSSPQNRCDCVHAPAEPEAVTVGTPTPSVDDIEPSALHSMNVVPSLAWTANGSRSNLAYGVLPPPLFILDCAFLI